MIVRAETLSAQTMEKPRGGTGTAVRMAYEAACGYKGEITNMAMMSLNPGSSIGYHQHVGDMELYLMLDGTAKTEDNGTEDVLNAGDLMVTRNGEWHSLVNESDSPVSFLAIIIKH
ncbi:MAG: cupin domain-containing protein [Deferribacterales bacterium]